LSSSLSLIDFRFCFSVIEKPSKVRAILTRIWRAGYDDAFLQIDAPMSFEFPDLSNSSAKAGYKARGCFDA
jgi:hypothetical protein